MSQTIKAIIDEDGKLRLLEKITNPKAQHALVTILDEKETSAAFLSEEALADWKRPEEDKAWEHLQRVP